MEVSSKVDLSPEEQFELYQGIRDGNIATVRRILFERPVVTGPLSVDCRPFEALWHDPGPEATPLHLAACCLQPTLVAWLLEQNADKTLVAQGQTALQMIDSFDLFAPARAQRPDDRLAVLALLSKE